MRTTTNDSSNAPNCGAIPNPTSLLIKDFFFSHQLRDVVSSLNDTLRAFAGNEPEHEHLELAIFHITGTTDLLLTLDAQIKGGANA